jgi:hypothetical protein
MRRWWLALGGGVALTGLLASGRTAMVPAADPGRTDTTKTAPAAGAGRAATATATAAQARPARPAPIGFWSGTDSWPVPVRGSGPYREPGTGAAYGGYVGMAGSWSYWLGCQGRFLAWSSANSAQANTEPETANLSDAPHGRCLKSGGCADFFGGVTRSSGYALMWQWSGGGGGVRNGFGDFDQIDASRQA